MSDFATPVKGTEQEEGSIFRPKFDRDGLVTAVAVDAQSGEVLMLAFMNPEALKLTIETGQAHYWSRSRQAIWLKGETSGNVQTIVEIRTDCDQDAIVMKVNVAGDEASCHTGRISCFYRALERTEDGALKLRTDSRDRKFDPTDVYGQQ